MSQVTEKSYVLNSVSTKDWCFFHVVFFSFNPSQCQTIIYAFIFLTYVLDLKREQHKYISFRQEMSSISGEEIDFPLKVLD